MVLGLVDEPVEDVVDLLADEGAQAEELAVDAVEGGLEQVALARVLRVEQVEQVEHEAVVDVALGDVRLEVGRLEDAQEQLVDELQVGPGRLQGGLVLLGIELGPVRIGGRRQGAEHVHGELQNKTSFDRAARSNGSECRTMLTISG